jgi:hypothetical protein
MNKLAWYAVTEANNPVSAIEIPQTLLDILKENNINCSILFQDHNATNLWDLRYALHIMKENIGNYVVIEYRRNAKALVNTLEKFVDYAENRNLHIHPDEVKS